MFPNVNKSKELADGGTQNWDKTGLFSWMGLRTVKIEGGYAKLVLDVKDHHRGGGGTAAVNGAVLAYMMDCVIGTAVHSGNPPQVTAQATLSLNIEYLAMAQAAESLVAEAEVVRRGARTVFADGRIYNEQGQLACRAHCIMRLFRTPANNESGNGAQQ